MNLRIANLLVLAGYVVLLLVQLTGGGVSVGETSLPISADGPRALVLAEDGYKNSVGVPYAKSQVDALASATLRPWLNQTYGAGNWRILDPTDSELTNGPTWLRELFAHYQAAEGHDSPWVIASDGSGGVNEPMPLDQPALEAQLLEVTK